MAKADELFFVVKKFCLYETLIATWESIWLIWVHMYGENLNLEQRGKALPSAEPPVLISSQDESVRVCVLKSHVRSQTGLPLS